MTDHPDKNKQMEMFDPLAKAAIYTPQSLAEKYGLSLGQARTLINIHGHSCDKLDKIIAAQPFR